MRRNLLIAAFLGTTMLSPSPADAMPMVGGWVLGALGIGSGAGLGAAAAGAFTLGAEFAATAIGGFAVRTVVAVGLSAISAALAPKPSVPPPSARMVSYAQPKAYAEWVFGRTRKGGPLGFTGFSSGRRYYVPILAAHEIEGFVEHWLDERTTALSASTDVDESNVTATEMAGYGRIDPFDGASGQTAHSGLVSEFTEFTSSHDFKGLAGAVLWAARPPQSRFSSVYPRSREWAYAPVIDGNNQIYDPRDETTGFSRNAALCIAWWIVNILGREVDWDEVADEADACDVSVTNAQSESQSKWEINGVISDEMDFEDQRAQMAAACDAFFYERSDGKVGFKVGRWIEPTITLTPDDFYGLEISEGGWGRPDEIQATYIEPSNAWRETPAGAWVENAAAKPIKEEPQLYLVHNHNQASRVAKRIGKTKHAQYNLSGSIGMMGYELLGQRFFRVQHPEMGIDEVFEIGEMAREGPGLFTITAVSVEETDFDFTASTEEPTQPDYSGVTNDDSVPDVASLAGSPLGGGSIMWTWSEPPDAYTQELRYREDGESYWLTVQTSESADRVLTSGLVDGVTYEAQVRNRTAGAGAGDWKPDTPVEVENIVNLTAPGALASFSASSGGYNSATVSFTAPNDAQYFGTKIYRATSTDFGTAVLVHTEYGIPSEGDDHTETVAGGTYYYWGEPINASGVAGTKSGPSSVTVSDPP